MVATHEAPAVAEGTDRAAAEIALPAAGAVVVGLVWQLQLAEKVANEAVCSGCCFNILVRAEEWIQSFTLEYGLLKQHSQGAPVLEV